MTCYNPSQNGVIEIMNRFIQEKVKDMLSNVEIPNGFGIGKSGNFYIECYGVTLQSQTKLADVNDHA